LLAPLALLLLALPLALGMGCRSLTGPSAAGDYYISSHDWSQALPDSSIDTTGVYDVRWTRRFHTAGEARLLRHAESLYPASARVALGRGGFQDQWWLASFDGIRVASLPTRGAAAYFRDLAARFRAGDFSGTLPMLASGLDYVAAIERRGSLEIDGQTHRNVYVAEIRLSWAQYCGSLCAMGFERRRTVVFDHQGRVLQVIDPEFLGYWVS
jgi:hypothetical protein